MARRLTKDQIISNVYYDIEGGFGSIQETYKKAKAHRDNIRRCKEVYEQTTQQTA